MDRHLLDEELRLATASLEQERHKRLLVLQHDLADRRRAAFAGAQDVVQAALLQRRYRRRRDHAPVRHYADAADAEALAQTVDHGQQHRHVGSVPSQHLGAHRAALAVEDHGQHHLPQVGAVVLGMAVRPQAVAARAVERQRRGVHEDQRQVGEEIPPALEQTLLDRVLHAARREIAVSGRLQLLAQPGHRPIEVVQTQVGRAGDGVVDHPLLARAVGARDEQAVQDADKDRPLEGELEAAPVQQIVHHRAQSQPFPEPSEQQWPADADAGESAGLHVRQHHRPLGMARQRGDQPVELAAGVEDILAAERADGALAHPLALADALDEVEVAVPPGDLLADEHRSVVPPDKPRINRNPYKTAKCSTTPFCGAGKPNSTIPLLQRLSRPRQPQIRRPLLKLGLRIGAPARCICRAPDHRAVHRPRAAGGEWRNAMRDLPASPVRRPGRCARRAGASSGVPGFPPSAATPQRAARAVQGTLGLVQPCLTLSRFVSAYLA